MSDQHPESEFDPATWTPDKPWPKGYYKPILGASAAMERIDRVAGPGTGFRRFVWGSVSLPLQGLGFAIVTTGRHTSYGLLHALAEHLTPVPAFLFFALLLPTLLFVGIVCDPGMPWRRSFVFGLLASVGGLVFLVFAMYLRPALNAAFDLAVRLLHP